MTVPEWLLERYALGELPDAERARVEADPDLGIQLEALLASDAAIRQTFDAAVIARRAHQRARPAGSSRRWVPIGGLAMAVAAVGLVVVFLPRGPDHRAKGGSAPALVVHQRLDGGSRVLGDGDLVEPGTVLQVEVVAPGVVHGWVLSVDGDRTVTLHNQGALGAGTSFLPTGYQLDDARGYEQFWLVVSDRAVERGVVERAVREAPLRSDGRGIALDVPGAEEVDVWLRKP